MVPWDNDKPTVVALREIAAGHMDLADKHEAEMEALAIQEEVTVIVDTEHKSSET